MKKKKMRGIALVTAIALTSAGCAADKNPATPENSASEGNAATQTVSSENGTGFNGPMVGQTAPRGAATTDDNIPVPEEGSAPAPKTGDTLINIDFEDGNTGDFMTFTNGGDLELTNTARQLDCSINKCGSVDYGNQAYLDGFELVQGCEYTYSFDICSDIERTVEYRLQLNGGDYHAYQGDYISISPEVLHFSVDFTMEEASDPAPRLVFNMGKMKDMSADPGDHHVFIDNIRLTVKNADNASLAGAGSLPAYLNVNTNQVGFRPDDTKTVFVKTENDGEDFFVCRTSDSSIIWQGKLSETADDPASRTKTARGDFSEVSEPGSYYIYTASGASYPFTIGEDVYNGLYKDVVSMLYRQRCGMALEGASAGAYAHEACHTAPAVIYGTNTTKDVSGGWHDAGDYGRYVVPGAKTVADLFAAYEDYSLTSDDMGIPESGNGFPDLLDEAKYELDWMLKMQDEKTGGVYHKVTCSNFPAMDAAPEEETEELIISPISVTATGDFAAVMAKASVIYKDRDPEFAKTAYGAAVKAWDYIADKEDTIGFLNPDGVETGEYPDAVTADERYWATAELYLACLASAPGSENDDPAKYSSRLEELARQYDEEKAAQNSQAGSDNASPDNRLGWADIISYAWYDLAKSDSEFSSAAKTKLTDEADKMLEASQKDRYFMCLGTDYYWGSNMGIASDAELLYMAANISDDAKAAEYRSLASRALDYLLGANALGYSFITGYGTFFPKDIHHRPSLAAGKVMPGLLAGGADNRMEDPYAESVLSEAAPSMCYVDNSQSYSTNEIAIYWNSPFIYILSAEMK